MKDAYVPCLRHHELLRLIRSYPIPAISLSTSWSSMIYVISTRGDNLHKPLNHFLACSTNTSMKHSTYHVEQEKLSSLSLWYSSMVYWIHLLIQQTLILTFNHHVYDEITLSFTQNLPIYSNDQTAKIKENISFIILHHMHIKRGLYSTQ